MADTSGPRHWHTGIESLVVGAVGVALVFHGFRFLGAFMAARQNPWVSKAGEVLGGAFTFGHN